ncbi:MAG: hypothetical protein V4812_19525 [Pseudomonadota bacterium]
MRIDGFTPTPLDRGPRAGAAVTPFREVQREIEQRREQPAAPASSQGFESVAQTRRVQPGNGSSENLPARPQDLYQQAATNNRAAQALASYTNTAGYGAEADAQEVLGLDLFA